MIDNAVSLFSGIGGFELALKRQGVDTVASAEIDRSCQDLLVRHFTHGIFTDVTELTGAQLLDTGFTPESGILTAGWPCQGNSIAGSRRGLADPRSGLWGQVARLLAEARPRYFIGENVPGLLSVNSGRDFLAVVKSLEELGYGVGWRVLDAQYFGVPQRRKRVFVVGCLGDGAGPAEILFEPESSEGDSAPGGEAGEGSARGPVVSTLSSSRGRRSALNAEEAAGNQLIVSTLQGGGKRGWRVDAEGAAGGQLVVAHTTGAGWWTEGFGALRSIGGAQGDHVVCVTGDVTQALTTANNGKRSSEDGTGRGLPIVPVPVDGYNLYSGDPDDPMYSLSTKQAHNRTLVAGMGVRRLTPRECERLQGFPDDWTAGQSDAQRYRQLGNAVAVPVVEWISHRLVAFDSTRKVA